MPAKVARSTIKKASTKKASGPAAVAQVEAPTVAAAPVSAVQKTMQNAFSSAQNTTATHKKLVITLRTLQEDCAKNGSEKEFKREFIKCLNRVLVVKKGEVVGDRVMRFCDLFVRHIHEKELKERKATRDARRQSGDVQDEEDEDEDEEEVPATVSTRFTTSLLKHLLYGLKAANKTVRFRVCQFLAMTLNSISALDETIFAHLKEGLIKRMMDREAPVRVQASLALMKLGFGIMEESDSDSDEEDEQDIGYVPGGVVARLIDRLSSDTSAEVRRAILLNLNHTPMTLPHLLERSRDADPLTRRLVYSRTLPSLGDFRLLSISMREKILRWGLQDRDQAVRKAAEKNFAEGWVQNANGDLLEVLERLDVINSKVAELALESFWRQGTGTEVDFGHEYWQNLTAESAFLVRTFNDYCRDPETLFDHHIDDKIPEVTHLAFIIQKYINLLVDSPAGIPLSVAGKNGTDDIAPKQDAAEVEFIVEQLLLIALKLDYGDEIGRRKMFSLLREALAIIDLPETTVSRVVEVLRKVSGSERDYCSVILETIAEVHDLIAPVEEDGNESFHSARSDVSDVPAKPKTRPKPQPKKKSRRDADDDDMMMDVDEDDDDDDDDDEKAIKEMVTNLRCLFIAQCMMENVEGDLKANAHLMTMLNGLIFPAVRSQEAPIRERGLRCLGLCCLLDKLLAEENLGLFALCFNKGHEEMQIECAHIICDVLVSHGSSLFESELCTIDQKTLYKMFTKATKLDDSPDVQAAIVEVLSKLMLARVVDDEEVLMQKIAVSTLHTLISMHVNIDEGEEMVSPTVIASQFADWTDPRKVFGAIRPGKDSLVNQDVHVDLALDIFTKLGLSGNKEDKKVLCQMLSKLYITQEATPEKLQELYEQVLDVIDRKCVTDSVSRNALIKFETIVSKLVSIVEANMRGEQSLPLTTSGDGDETVTTVNGDGDETIVSELGDLSIVGEDEEEELRKTGKGQRTDTEDEDGEGTSVVGDVTEEDEENY